MKPTPLSKPLKVFEESEGFPKEEEIIATAKNVLVKPEEGKM